MEGSSSWALERLKSTSALLVRHSNALAELIQTSADLKALLSEDHEEQGKNVGESVDKFRAAAIAPLQTLLSSFPHLRHRMDHRKCALELMQRYQSKIDDMQQRGESSRLHRNKMKLQAAQERFTQLDKDVREQVASILAIDLSHLIQVPLLQLAESQQQWATALQNNSQQLKHSVALPSFVKKEDPQEDTFNDKVSCIQHKSCESDELGVLDKTRAMRPKQQHVYGTRTWDMHKHIKDSLAQGLDVIECIQLPPGFARGEWIVVHVIDFFNEVSLLYGTISELCTTTSCPQMSAGPCYTYLWADESGANPLACSANVYVDKLLRWVETQLQDQSVFPINMTLKTEQSAAFMPASKTILKRLFRVYAHIYHSHLDDFIALHAESHLNFCFKRFVYFVLEFDLVEKKELNALRKLIATIAPGRL
ncbi:hypothetical protein THRCLA_07094 [Thraustotheca clavata]|uniref:Uncharacterized protein n=1 Tax=Thraustotheca clavata TaxID=74557 RepID=A0A1V9ZGJ1_9STRA|nr:hypothetical protein THRCLA_07094 [Thraustotheca clavata]